MKTMPKNEKMPPNKKMFYQARWRWRLKAHAFYRNRARNQYKSSCRMWKSLVSNATWMRKKDNASQEHHRWKSLFLGESWSEINTNQALEENVKMHLKWSPSSNHDNAAPELEIIFFLFRSEPMQNRTCTDEHKRWIPNMTELDIMFSLECVYIRPSEHMSR